MGTDFTSWSEKEIIAFLDRRGEDYEDCIDAFALVARAQECEHNTVLEPPSLPHHAGPATRPDLKDETAAPESEADALEAFMAEIEENVKQAEATASDKKPANTTAACDAEDDMDDYIEAHAARQGRGATSASQPVAETHDSDDEAAELEAHREIKPLEDVDHSKINYEAFKKDFYDESPDVFVLDDEEVRQQRAQLEISAQGRDVPKPVSSFEQCGFPPKLIAAVTSAGFSKPTAVQCQVLPVALSGRNVVGIAQTGSGKTAAFLLPMVIHCAAQARVRAGQGPIAIIIAPVRELAEQIHREARRFCKPLGLRVCAAFGGMQKHAQKRELLGGVEAAVATPGRLIDLVECGACKLERVTMFIVDEVQSIAKATRPDRQTLLFSATLPQRVKRLVRESLTDEVSVTVGHAGAAHADVQQEVLLMPNADAKMQWLQARMPRLVDEGQVLVFVNSRAVVDGVVTLLQSATVKVGGIHGDMDQFSRSSVLAAFKAGTVHVMVATDVAARGLDIRSVKIVVNYDVARSFESHVHRIGRTGRAGDAGGRAITLIMPQETRMAAAIAESLQAGGKPVPKNLQDIALKNPGYRKMIGVPMKGAKAPAVGGAGLGFGSASAAKPPSFVAATATPPAASVASSSQQPPASTAPQETESGKPSSRFGGFSPALSAQPTLVTQAGLPGPPPRPHAAPVQSATAPVGGVVGAKRSFSESSATRTPAQPQQAAQRPAAAAQLAGVTIKAPKGFVKSSLTVGGDEQGPQIVLPTAAAAAKAEAPAAWLQKRIQQKKQFGSAGGYQPRPAAAAQPAAPPMNARSMADAVRKAQEAAARIMGSSQSVSHGTNTLLGGTAGPSPGHLQPAPHSSGAAAMGTSHPPHAYSQAYPAQAPVTADVPPWQQHAQGGLPPQPIPKAYGVPSMHGGVQPSAAQPNTQAPRLTPEEARRLAQEAAQRASMSAAQNKGEKWEWAKT